jgi:hypothetical protein
MDQQNEDVICSRVDLAIPMDVLSLVMQLACLFGNFDIPSPLYLYLRPFLATIHNFLLDLSFYLTLCVPHVVHLELSFFP